MNKAGSKIMAMVFFIIISTLFVSCAHKGVSDIEAEKWEMQLKGDTVAKLNLVLKRKQIENDIYRVTGNLKGVISDHIGGRGPLECSMSGNIKGNVLQGRCVGTAKMVTTVEVLVILKGTITQFQGSGTYHVTHDEGSSKGDWVMQIVQ